MKLTKKEKQAITGASRQDIYNAVIGLEKIGVNLAETACATPCHHPDMFSAIEAVEPFISEQFARRDLPISIVTAVIFANRLAIRAAFEADKEINEAAIHSGMN